jgi:hypothetical protein
VAEAIFAGKKIEKLARVKALTTLALTEANIAKFADDVFVCNRPGHRRNRQSDDKERG